MRNIIRFVLFLIYTVAIFFIKDIKILGIIFALNCIVAVLVRVNIKKFFGDLKIILPFLILTFIFNMFFDGWICGILITIRIIICYQITCIFSLIMTVIEISDINNPTDKEKETLLNHFKTYGNFSNVTIKCNGTRYGQAFYNSGIFHKISIYEPESDDTNLNIYVPYVDDSTHVVSASKINIQIKIADIEDVLE